MIDRARTARPGHGRQKRWELRPTVRRGLADEDRRRLLDELGRVAVICSILRAIP